MADIPSAALACGVAILNIVATRAVLAADDFERPERNAQLLLIWLLPVVGAVIVIALLRELSKPHYPNARAAVHRHDSVDPIDLALAAKRDAARHNERIGDD